MKEKEFDQRELDKAQSELEDILENWKPLNIERLVFGDAYDKPLTQGEPKSEQEYFDQYFTGV